MIVVVERSPTRARRRAPRATGRSRSCPGRAPRAPRRRGSRPPCRAATRGPRRAAARGSLERQAERGRALPDLERAEGVHVQVGHRVLHRAHDSRVESPVKAGWMPPWRQISVAPRSHASSARRTISSSGTRYGAPAQVRRQLALRERAEAAAEVADVRVVDVPRDDVADDVAADLARGARRRRRARAARSSPRASKSAHDVVLAELAALARRAASGVAARDERRAGSPARRRPSASSRARPEASARAAPAAATAGSSQRSPSATKRG